MSRLGNTSRYVSLWLCAQLLPHALCKVQLHGATAFVRIAVITGGERDRAGGVPAACQQRHHRRSDGKG
jgi:hypothetical protein